MTGPDVKSYSLSPILTSTTGTVAITIGSPIVTGTGTSFLGFGIGDTLVIGGEEHTVLSITSSTVLNTVGNWAQALTGVGFTHHALDDLEARGGVAFPKGIFTPYSQPLDLGDGSLRAGGWATAEWQWQYITRVQRTFLRSYWPAAPAIPGSYLMRVRTSINDSNDAFVTFLGQAIWPQFEPKDATRRVPFVLRFRALVDVS